MLRTRALVDTDKHLFPQPELIEENSKRTRALVDIGEHLFQQPEFKEDKKKWCAEHKQEMSDNQKKRQHDVRNLPHNMPNFN